MKYKGYEIEKQFLPGSDFRILKNGILVDRKPQNCHIDYYCAEQVSTGFTAANCKTLAEMKEHIDALNKIEGLYQ